MPPIRRYVRISRHSLLEVRVFLENPADGPRWLLSHREPALPRVFEAVRPLILPKLREERERTALTKGKGKRGKSVKDVVEGEGFRCIVFLTEGATRHELAVKIKTAKERQSGRARARGIESKTGASKANAVVIREEDEDADGDINLADLPLAQDEGEEEREEDDDLPTEIGYRRHRDVDGDEEGDSQAYQDDKKKLGFDTRYEGFSIWGKVLCLLVERTGPASKKSSLVDTNAGDTGAQKVMQEWISSTQVGAEDEDG